MGLFNITIENSTLASHPWKFNKTFWASFELYPEWTGSRFYGFRGVAFNEKDYWSETPVVVKTFRHSDGREGDWMTYKRRCDIGRKMATEFNKYLEASQCHWKVNFVNPTGVVMDSISDIMPLTRFVMRFSKRFSQDEAVLMEDLLEGDFKTFVTSNGETTADGSHILDTFSHYTYHASGQTCVICNIKGVEEDGQFKLTNPVIHSTECDFGDMDKSVNGIRTFFKNHICSALCKDFSKPVLCDSTVQPLAPVVEMVGNTHTKAVESDSLNSGNLEMCKLPEYMPVDPNGPPPYVT